MSYRTEIIEELQNLAKTKGLPISKACELAGVRAATFSDWKAGRCAPNTDTADSIKAAIERYHVQTA